MRRIIISYAAYGGGHLSAAKSLKEYIELNYPDCDVFLFDCMKYINRVIDKVCGSTYSKITTDIPWFWGKVYYHTQDPIFERIMSLSNKLLAYKLNKLLREFKPDIIISTHFFVGHMCSFLKQKGKINSTIATVITDFGEDPYNEWISNHEYIDYIFVAHDKIKKKLIEKGVLQNKVFSTGIPISTKFLENYNKNEILKDLNFSNNKKNILFFGGGEFGLCKSKNLEIFEIISRNFLNTQIIAIAGKNENLKNNFINIAKKYNRQNDIKIFGFTNDVAKYMSISDLVITKPGGLTSTEALVSNLPILAISPIPGQEEENAQFLEENGTAKWLRKNENINLVLASLLNNNEILTNMRENTKRIARPNSTQDICKILLEQNN